MSFSVHISKVTRVCSGVPFAGLQREIRSGRGLPTAFFITSVMKLVSIILIIVSSFTGGCLGVGLGLTI